MGIPEILLEKFTLSKDEDEIMKRDILLSGNIVEQ